MSTLYYCIQKKANEASRYGGKTSKANRCIYVYKEPLAVAQQPLYKLIRIYMAGKGSSSDRRKPLGTPPHHPKQSCAPR